MEQQNFARVWSRFSRYILEIIIYTSARGRMKFCWVSFGFWLKNARWDDEKRRVEENGTRSWRLFWSYGVFEEFDEGKVTNGGFKQDATVIRRWCMKFKTITWLATKSRSSNLKVCESQTQIAVTPRCIFNYRHLVMVPLGPIDVVQLHSSSPIILLRSFWNIEWCCLIAAPPFISCDSDSSSLSLATLYRRWRAGVRQKRILNCSLRARKASQHVIEKYFIDNIFERFFKTSLRSLFLHAWIVKYKKSTRGSKSH